MKSTKQKNPFLATYLKKDEIHLEYSIGYLEDSGLPSPKIHKKFNKIYGKNFVSKEDIYETQIPEIHSAYYNYSINGVKVQFYCMNPKLHRTIWPTKIYCQGLEKNINKLVNEMKNKFHMEEN